MMVSIWILTLISYPWLTHYAIMFNSRIIRLFWLTVSMLRIFAKQQSCCLLSVLCGKPGLGLPCKHTSCSCLCFCYILNVVLFVCSLLYSCAAQYFILCLIFSLFLGSFKLSKDEASLTLEGKSLKPTCLSPLNLGSCRRWCPIKIHPALQEYSRAQWCSPHSKPGETNRNLWLILVCSDQIFPGSVCTGISFRWVRSCLG